MPDNQTLALPPIEQFVVNLVPYRYNKGDDTEFIRKANGKQEYLEEFFAAYNTGLRQYGEAILLYFEAAQQVPIDIKQEFAQMVNDAQTAANQAAASLAGLSFPAVTPADAGKVLGVNSQGQYALMDVSIDIDNDFLKIKIGGNVVDSLSLKKYEEISSTGEYTYSS